MGRVQERGRVIKKKGKTEWGKKGRRKEGREVVRPRTQKEWSDKYMEGRKKRTELKTELMKVRREEEKRKKGRIEGRKE